MKPKTAVCLLAASILAWAAPSYGSSIAVTNVPALLAPGASISSLPNFADAGVGSGLNVFAVLSQSFAGGSLTELVVNNTAFSPFGSAFYAFAFSITMTSGSISSFTAPGFAGFGTAVKETTLAVGNPADAVGVSRDASGDKITFTFVPGTTQTPSLAIYTNALGFVDPPIAINLLDASGAPFTVNIEGFSPAAVPEPGTLLLISSGFAALAAARRRQSHSRR